MTSLPTPGVLAVYKVSLFDAHDAARILQKTGKPSCVTAERAAALLNSAIRRCILEMGVVVESPASEHAAWAAQLAEALDRGLSLLAPSTTATHAPTHSNLIEAYARLFNAGMPPPKIDGLLKRHGFTSPQQAMELSAIGLWLLHAFAVHSGAEWRKKVRPADDMGRRGPAGARVVWVRVLGNLYCELTGAQPPRAPTADSPFIRFCGEVRAIVLTRCAAASTESSMRLFLEMLRDAKPARLAAFISRHKGTWDSGASASPAKQAATAS
jgi:hypothetical protein